MADKPIIDRVTGNRTEYITNLQTRTAEEYMPPVIDIKTGETKFICYLCGKKTTLKENERLSFYFNERVIGGSSTGGPICPSCDVGKS